MKNSYIAPDPTPEQLENAILKGYSPYDCAGSLPYWECSSDDTLAAPATIHDELCLIGGDAEQLALVAKLFRRDCNICAAASGGMIRRIFEAAKAGTFSMIVDMCISNYWSTEDRNTKITRCQAEANILDAEQWINACARKIGYHFDPYPSSGVGDYLIIEDD